MKVRINISTDAEPQSYLVDLGSVLDTNLKDAIIHCMNSPKTCKTFGQYEVVYGTIIQNGYEMNEQIRQISEDTVIEIPVITQI